MSTRMWPIALSLLAACGGGGGGGDDDPMIDAGPDAPPPVDARPITTTNPGVIVPTAIAMANVNSAGVWSEIGPADWTCLCAPSTNLPSSGPITLTGRIRDFQTGNGIGNATISAWSTSPGTTVGLATSSDVAATRGDFTMSLAMLPAGTRRYSFTITGSQHLTTRVLRRYYAPGAAANDDLIAISQATALALPAFIGLERDPTKSLYLGTVVDCQGRPVSNAVVGLSGFPTTYEEGGGITFYFSAGSTSLPVRHTVEPVLNNDGLFVILDAPPDTQEYLQVWGFRTPAELAAGSLTLLAELPVLAKPDDAVTTTLAPRRPW